MLPLGSPESCGSTSRVSFHASVRRGPPADSTRQLSSRLAVSLVPRGTGRDVREICQVRRALECEAVRAACGRIDAAELGALSAALEKLLAVKKRQRPGFIDEARQVDSRLHDAIAASCGNAFL